MITVQNQLILKRTVYKQNGQQTTKSYKLLRCRSKTQQTQIYDVYDSQLNQELTLKIIIKNNNLSKQKCINQIKNQQLFLGKTNFINLYDIYEDTHNIYLLMQKWGTTLGDLINQRGSLTQFQTQLIFSQLVDLIIELRKCNIAHNYITLDSLYVDIKQKHKLKLGDFKRSFNIGSYFQSFSNQLQKMNQPTSNSNLGIIKPLRKLKQNHPYLNSSLNRQQNQKYTHYTSPQQLLRKTFSQDYNKLIESLYQNDIWNIGIILFRVLLGRFPFDQQHDNSLNAANDNQLNFDVFTSKSQYQNAKKIQCIYNFTTYRCQNQLYCQPISLQFKQLIKSLIRPVSKRITLKSLINHPLKLQSYYNIHDMNFDDELPPLFGYNVVRYKVMKPIKSQLMRGYLCQQNQNDRNDVSSNKNLGLFGSSSNQMFMRSSNQQQYSYGNKSDDDNDQIEYDNQENILEDDNYNGSGRRNRQNAQPMQHTGNNLRQLTPSVNYSLFSLFNDDMQQRMDMGFSQVQQKVKREKYAFTWDLNFSQQLSSVLLNRDNDQMQKMAQPMREMNQPFQLITSTAQNDQMKKYSYQSATNYNKSSLAQSKIFRKVSHHHTSHTQKFNQQQSLGQNEFNKQNKDIYEVRQRQKQNLFKKNNSTIIGQSKQSRSKRDYTQSTHNNMMVNTMQGLIGNNFGHNNQNTIQAQKNYSNNNYTNSITSNFNIRNINSKKNIIQVGMSIGKTIQEDKNQYVGNGNFSKSNNDNFIIRNHTNSRHYTKINNQTLKINPDNKTRQYPSNQDQIQQSSNQTMMMTSQCQYQHQHQANNKNNQLGYKRFKNQQKQNGMINVISSQAQQSSQHTNNHKLQLIILRNLITSIPLLITQPQFILQYKYSIKNNTLGYVLNNGIGIYYTNGKLLLGHNQNDFMILSADMKDDRNTNTYNNNQLTNNNNSKFTNFTSQKLSKYSSSSGFKTLTQGQMEIYNDYLKIFGKRMVVSNYNKWIIRYWKHGRIFVFLFNNGCWQVTLEGKKTSKFFIVDQNQLVWTKGKTNIDMINQIRQIVNQKRQMLVKQQYFFK